MAKKVSSEIGFSFIPIPRIDRDETIRHLNGKIVLRGADFKASVWAKDKYDASEILGNFASAVADNADPQFAIKLITSVESESAPLHPSNPDWAYSQISISNIPLLEITDHIWKKILDQLKAYEDGTWEDTTDQSRRFLFEEK